MRATDPNASACSRSGERFDRLRPEELDNAGRTLRDAIVTERRSTSLPLESTDGTLEGPFGVFLFSPEIGEAWHGLGNTLRARTALTDRLRELVVVTVASAVDSTYELHAHLPAALAAGLSEEELLTVCDGGLPEDPLESDIVRCARAIALGYPAVREFDAVRSRLDRRALTDLFAVAAHYRTLAALLVLFGIGAPQRTDPAAERILATRSTSSGTVDPFGQLVEEREISRVLTALARCVDSHDFDGLAELYADDGALVTPNSTHRGRVGLADFVRDDIGIFAALHHVSAGHEIDVVPGADVATARCTLLASHVRDDGTAHTTGGHYDIELVRDRGRWRLQEVVIVPAWRQEWTATQESGTGRTHAGGAHTQHREVLRLPGARFSWDHVEIDGLAIEYASAGPHDAEATIVSLPGSAGIEMSTAKDLLTTDLRVVEINPPGWGGRPAPGRAVTQNEMAELLARVVQAVVPGPVVLLGTSAGGANALCMASELGSRVRGILLEGSIAPTLPRDHKGPMFSNDREPDTEDIPENLPAPRPHARKPWATEQFFCLRRVHQRELFAWFRPDYMPDSALQRIAAAQTPVAVLLGDEDELIHPEQESTVSSVLPHASFTLLPGGRHDLQNTVPELFVSSVREFINSITPGAVR